MHQARSSQGGHVDIRSVSRVRRKVHIGEASETDHSFREGAALACAPSQDVYVQGIPDMQGRPPRRSHHCTTARASLTPLPLSPLLQTSGTWHRM